MYISGGIRGHHGNSYSESLLVVIRLISNVGVSGLNGHRDHWLLMKPHCSPQTGAQDCLGRGNDDIGDVVVLLLPSFLACILIKWLGGEMLYVKCVPSLFSVHSHFLTKDMLCVKCTSCTVFQLPAWRLLHVHSLT